MQKVGAVICCVCMYLIGGPLGLCLLLLTDLLVPGELNFRRLILLFCANGRSSSVGPPAIEIEQFFQLTSLNGLFTKINQR